MRLLGLLGELGGGARFERSFKILPGALEARRFILAVDKRDIAGDADAAVLRTCEGLGMPSAGLDLFRAQVAEASVIGFGLDEDETTCVVKGYLEFRRRYAEARREPRAPTWSYVSHLGIKWDAAEPARHVVAEYRCFPALTVDDMLARIDTMATRRVDGGALAVVRGIVELAAQRVPGDRMPYLEVAEAGTPRASFDVNVYAAGLRIADVHDALASLCARYGIADREFRTLDDTMREAALGHLAGGTDRAGREFLTVYFEE